MRIILIGWPRVLGPCPAYGCVAASKCFGGCRDLAPWKSVAVACVAVAAILC